VSRQRFSCHAVDGIAEESKRHHGHFRAKKKRHPVSRVARGKQRATDERKSEFFVGFLGIKTTSKKQGEN
jgi:hypothetical protein